MSEPESREAVASGTSYGTWSQMAPEEQWRHVNSMDRTVSRLHELVHEMRLLLDTAVDGWDGAEGDWIAFRLSRDWFDRARDLSEEVSRE